MKVKQILILFMIISTFPCFALKVKGVQAIERYETNTKIAKGLETNIRKSKRFSDLYVKAVKNKKKWPLIYYETLNDLNKVEKYYELNYVLGHKKEFLIYYSEGGHFVEATLHPLEQNIDDKNVRYTLVNKLKNRMEHLVYSLCFEELELSCGDMSWTCSDIQKTIIKKIAILSKYNKDIIELYKNYKKVALKSYKSDKIIYLKKVPTLKNNPVISYTVKEVEDLYNNCISMVNKLKIPKTLK